MKKRKNKNQPKERSKTHKLTETQIEILKKGNFEEIKKEFKDQPTMNLKDQKKKTAIHYLCMNNPTMEALEFFHEKMTNFNSRTKISFFEELAPIHLFVLHNQEQLLERLLSYGANVNNLTRRLMETALHLAVKNELPRIIGSLVKHGADINIQNQTQETPLISCCKYKPNRHIVKYLLSKGALVNCLDSDLRDALFYLVKSLPKMRLFNLFVEKNVFIEPVENGRRRSYTLLHSCCGGSPTLQMVKKIVSYGYKPKWKDKEGNTSLHYLCMSKIGSRELQLIVSYFLRLGCGINDTNKKQETCFHCLCMNQLPLESYQFLANKGSKIDLLPQSLCSALHLICKHNPQLEILQWLLENGLQKHLYLTPKLKNTLLHEYCSNKLIAVDVPILQFLLDQGLDINNQNFDRNTALHLLLENTPNIDISVIEFMISKGANLNLRNSSRNNILHVLLNHKEFLFNDQTFDLILKNGINLNKQGSRRFSSFHLICSTPNPSINLIKSFLSHGGHTEYVTGNGMNCFALYLKFCQNYNLEIIKLLMANPSNKSCGNIEEFSFLAYATKILIAKLKKNENTSINHPNLKLNSNQDMILINPKSKKEWKKEARKNRKLKKKKKLN
ncbi:molting protein mlt-4 [Anaeramoeba flamelloides]|uniref:Molting protein mlt-4 n=1 Tax=Anaeramoeba flamelloides TaxID=1746091 RepID=A0AAV7ZZ07_9EUKA|nr:molting protein mlt-4 [Anaeramoeba flamelloides]